MKKDGSKVISLSESRSEKVINFNRESYGNLIRARRTALGMTQLQIAEQLGVTKMMVTHWEAGRAKPDLNVIPELCRILQITYSYFFGIPGAVDEMPSEDQDLVRNYHMLSANGQRYITASLEALLDVEAADLRRHCITDFVRIPVNEQRACAGLFNPLDSAKSGESIYLKADAKTRRADEIIIVTGDSMEPTYSDGDLLLVQHTPELNYGDIGVFVINGDGFVKEYRENGVYSHNSAVYPFRKLGAYDNVVCVGRVLGKVDESYYPDQTEKRVLNELQWEETAARQ